MISTKMTALIVAITALGVGSPLAAVAQIPEEEDTNLAGLIALRSDVIGRLLDEADVGSDVEEDVIGLIDPCTGGSGPHEVVRPIIEAVLPEACSQPAP
jgi:hypothetical protein